MKWSRHLAWLLPAWAAVAGLAQDGAVGDGLQVRVVRGEEAVRQLINEAMYTQYCGFAMEEAGIGSFTALTGKSPVGRGGFAKAEEDDWLPVAIRMGREDLERLQALHGLLSAENTDAGVTEADLRERIDATFDHLSRLTQWLGQAGGHASEVLDFLETVGQTKLPGMQDGIVERLGPPQVGFWCVWIRLSDLDSEEGVARCLSAGEKYAAEYGFGSQGNLAFCVQWLKEGAPRCHWEQGYARGARHVLKSIGHFGQHKDCSMVDNEAANGGLSGWVGSVQRRRMAGRFLDVQPVVRRFDKEKNEYVEEVWETLRPALLSFRAAAELAADEKDLTDLREVYGTWEEEGDATEPPEAGEMRASPCDGAVPEGKTYRDYPEWELLPKGPDMDDEACERAFQQLVAEGDAGHEALLAIVRECEDPMFASRALAVLRLSSGDKSNVREELKQILAERLPHASGPEEWLMTSIAEALVVIGTERDMDALAPMLAHPTRRVRIIGARCLGKRGGQSAIAILENAKSQNPEKRALEEIDAAIATIKSRLAENDLGGNPLLDHPADSTVDSRGLFLDSTVQGGRNTPGRNR